MTFTILQIFRFLSRIAKIDLMVRRGHACDTFHSVALFV